MVEFHREYIATGGNRHPSAADWDTASGLLAYGADRNVALWLPLDENYQGVKALLGGHADQVNAVKFLPTSPGVAQVILSGSADKTVRVWRAQSFLSLDFESVAILKGHDNSVNCLAVFKHADILASGSADSTIKIWRLNNRDAKVDAELLQTLQTNPRFFPLALALCNLPTAEDLVLAAAGTKSTVQVYVNTKDGQFHHQATLTGHEGWVRYLAITQEMPQAGSDLLLATASQDKYIRLWRITKTEDKLKSKGSDALGALEQPLSNKAHSLEASLESYRISFEALLPGHEDWIYTISWLLDEEHLQLLSASADNSVAIWQREKCSGVWVCTTRLGEISAQKGSTTATGTTGGFWIGLWSPNGQNLVSLGRTGSWRLWNYDKVQARWMQGVGISGHTKPVTDVAWSKDGSYLLSIGSDQTTRLHAAWKRGAKNSWHEMARPQIHGYDLNCIDSIGQTQIISGADEKLLRVFDEPRATACLLDHLSGIKTSAYANLSSAANIPVLGLSNKATQDDEVEGIGVNGDADVEEVLANIWANQAQPMGLGHPPFEDQLARHTLWPEREKLYGHGYEISAVAATNDSSVVATSCKASSIDHAVIRLYTTNDWREVKPPLVAHSSTVLALRFSEDDQLLLSVGRDRLWAIFERDSATHARYLLKHSNPKGHSRMILDACWAPAEAGRVFTTAGRDKTIKIWSMDKTKVDCMLTITALSSVTAVNVSPVVLGDKIILAVGTETGAIGLHIVELSHWSIKSIHQLETALQPTKSVSKLLWRPAASKVPIIGGNGERQPRNYSQLVVASEDSSLRLFSITGLPDC